MNSTPRLQKRASLAAQYLSIYEGRSTMDSNIVHLEYIHYLRAASGKVLTSVAARIYCHTKQSYNAILLNRVQVSKVFVKSLHTISAYQGI